MTRAALAVALALTLVLASPIGPGPPVRRAEANSQSSPADPVDRSGPAVEACLGRPSTITLEGSQRPYPGIQPTPDGSGIDARQAFWDQDMDYPILIRGFEGEERRDLCFVGGRVSSPHPHETTPWGVWHDSTGMLVRRQNFQLIDTEFANVGDGVRFAGPEAQNWSVQGVRMSRVHDDCIENDSMQSGTIDHSFFDGCYVFYSARGSPSGGADGYDNTVTITDSVVRMEPMPFLYDKSPGPGHGPIFKLSSEPRTGTSPRLVIRNTVFRVDQAPSHGTLRPPTIDHDRDPSTDALSYLAPDDCSDNTIVWLGEGPFPDTLPDCFEITTDPNVWRLAVADWATTPDVAAQAAGNVADTLFRATCGRIGSPGD